MRQLPDGIAVGRREDLLHCLLPGQPELCRMLGRVERRHRDPRHAEAEDMLDIVSHVRSVAGAPLRPDLVAVGEPPVGQRADRQAGFLDQFAPRRRLEVGIVRLTRAGDGLPEAGIGGPLDQQHIQRGRMDHDEHGFGELERHRAQHIRSAGLF